jgi:hypothetical protein
MIGARRQVEAGDVSEASKGRSLAFDLGEHAVERGHQAANLGTGRRRPRYLAAQVALSDRRRGVLDVPQRPQPGPDRHPPAAPARLSIASPPSRQGGGSDTMTWYRGRRGPARACRTTPAVSNRQLNAFCTDL